MQNPERPRWAIGLALFLALFGTLSLISGGAVLFVGGRFQELAGDYVPFVLWFNFLIGFAYIAGAAGLIKWRAWVRPLSVLIATLTIFVFIAFGVHMLSDGTYEIRTIGAMAFRSLIWVGVVVSLRGAFR
jgi:hypothetical protein